MDDHRLRVAFQNLDADAVDRIVERILVDDTALTLRDVEEATGKEVSNAYLSQLESGRISKPSVHVLYALSTSLGVPYETLMERAGYIVPSGHRAEGQKHGKATTYSIDNLSADEEKELMDCLNLIRSKRK